MGGAWGSPAESCARPARSLPPADGGREGGSTHPAIRALNPAVGAGSSARPPPSSGVTGWTERKRSVDRPKRLCGRLRYHIRRFLRQPASLFFSTLKPRCLQAVCRSPAALRAPGSLPGGVSTDRTMAHLRSQGKSAAARHKSSVRPTTDQRYLLARTCTLPTLTHCAAGLSVCERRAAGL